MKPTVALTLLVLFISCSETPVMQTFDWQGHRGARGNRPENTLPAFHYALDAGMTTLELDLAVSSDSQLIVTHEPWMNAEICLDPLGNRIPRMEEKRHNIFAMTMDSVRTYDCGSLKNTRFPEQQPQPAYKPVLREVVRSADRYAAKIGREQPDFNIEIKSSPEWDGVFTPGVPRFVELVLQEIAQLGIADRTTVQSFDERVLVELRKQGTTTNVAYLTEELVDLEQKTKSFGFVPDIWSPYYPLVNEASMNIAKGLNMKVIPWTVNDSTIMRNLKELGVDGIITDYPERATAL